MRSDAVPRAAGDNAIGTGPQFDRADPRPALSDSQATLTALTILLVNSLQIIDDLIDRDHIAEITQSR